jgi:hypothetical protein
MGAGVAGGGGGRTAALRGADLGEVVPGGGASFFGGRSLGLSRGGLAVASGTLGVGAGAGAAASGFGLAAAGSAGVSTCNMEASCSGPSSTSMSESSESKLAAGAAS